MTLSSSSTKTKKTSSKSLWRYAMGKILSEHLSRISLIIVCIYFLLAILSLTGIVAHDWAKEVGVSYDAPSSAHIFGTDLFGRDVLQKSIKGIETAVAIGIATSLISTIIGTLLGLVAGFYGGFIDELIQWFVTTVASIPQIMLLVAIAFILGKGTTTVFLSLGLTFWINLYRLVRGEVIKHKDREYTHAASAIGATNMRKIFYHILPNINHILIINFSQTFEAAIKYEVILSYLGLGVQGRPSWGVMIDDSKLELARGVWWQLAAAVFFMFFIVLAFNILGDALRDALDPKLKGK